MILQKAELSGSWKRAYFKQVWERLHTDRGWTAIDNSDDNHGDDDSAGDEEESSDDEGSDDGSDQGDDSDDGSESGGENGGQMSALIKAAAIWLTEQDQTKDSKSRSKGRGLPGKRGNSSSKSLPTKRRRVGL